jgi:ArsR family metal-binding transcriptional regulator
MISTEKKIEYETIQRLSDDYEEAMDLIVQMKEIEESLPGLDCGACGAPSCEAFAEDIVRGYAKKSDCIILLRDKLQEDEGDDSEAGQFIPRPFRTGD